jgi:membrane-bound metal-dependent hydrolase YbcI (DUF457 family)
MPSPLGHALGGAIVAMLMAPRPNPTRRTYPTDQTYLTCCAVAACLPDIDFLWGRHSMETHSVGAATIAGLVAYVVTRRPALSFAVALAWGSHILFDWLGSDDTPPLGVMALWPFTSHFYFAEAFVFEAISRRYAEPGFWAQNIWAVVKEALMLGPPAVALWWWRKKGFNL